MKIIELHFRSKKIIKILDFQNENHGNYENHRISNENLEKIMKVIGFRMISIQIMKIIEFN